MNDAYVTDGLLFAVIYTEREGWEWWEWWGYSMKGWTLLVRWM